MFVLFKNKLWKATYFTIKHFIKIIVAIIFLTNICGQPILSCSAKKIVLLSNQIFHYTHCITPKRVTSWRGLSTRHCAWDTQLFSK